MSVVLSGVPPLLPSMVLSLHSLVFACNTWLWCAPHKSPRLACLSLHTSVSVRASCPFHCISTSGRPLPTQICEVLLICVGCCLLFEEGEEGGASHKVVRVCVVSGFSPSCESLDGFRLSLSFCGGPGSLRFSQLCEILGSLRFSQFCESHNFVGVRAVSAFHNFVRFWAVCGSHNFVSLTILWGSGRLPLFTTL